VRMGDLSWDSFEPSQGRFEFEWFDRIMDKMHADGIRVILDIPGLPAPIWLHRAYPGIDIVAQNGTRLAPAERYMDNISDPNYVREVGIMAEALMKRYAHHPAVIAVGYDNEIGNGFMSYSEADRQRFIAWLKKKYGTISELNIEQALNKADAAHVSHPRLQLDLLCVADLAAWTSSMMTFIGPSQVPDWSQMAPMYGQTGAAVSDYVGHTRSNELQVEHFTPTGVLISHLSQKLAWENPSFRDLADYYRRTNIGALARGTCGSGPVRSTVKKFVHVSRQALL